MYLKLCWELKWWFFAPIRIWWILLQNLTSFIQKPFSQHQIGHTSKGLDFLSKCTKHKSRSKSEMADIDLFEKGGGRTWPTFLVSERENCRKWPQTNKLRLFWSVTSSHKIEISERSEIDDFFTVFFLNKTPLCRHFGSKEGLIPDLVGRSYFWEPLYIK